YWRSEANSVLVFVGTTAEAEAVVEALAAKRIFVRDRSTQPGCESCIRITTETQIALTLTIECKGRYEVRTGIRFFDHMLELFTRHGAFDLKLQATGDLDVDQHHTVEDVGIALGEAFHSAL